LGGIEEDFRGKKTRKFQGEEGRYSNLRIRRKTLAEASGTHDNSQEKPEVMKRRDGVGDATA